MQAENIFKIRQMFGTVCLVELNCSILCYQLPYVTVCLDQTWAKLGIWIPELIQESFLKST